MSDKKLHEQQSRDRDKYTQLIIQSTAKNKVVIAGPGTGKTTTFRKLLETKSGDKLALTFINNLADDLQQALGELAESHTFHGYCKKLLHRISVEGIDSKFHYFPKLNVLVKLDSEYIGANLNEFDEAFNTLTEDERMAFYLERGNYYNAVAHSDAVYRVLKYFQSGKDSLPSFSQIVVDEYQDFNKLEVSFIDELAKANPVLIVGDDDQAIYDFKDARSDYIRDKWCQKDFEKFQLPYCSRCTQVIVDAVHDITTRARAVNKLQGRIEKQLVCFLPDKEKDSIKYPKIIHVNCSTHTKKAPYISKFIEREISLIPQEEIDDARKEGYPCVLIAGPSHYTKQICDYLKSKFTNIISPEERDRDLDILNGYGYLIEDEQSNLGWRIILECTQYAQMTELLKETHYSKQKLADVLEGGFKERHLAVLAILRKIKSCEAISRAEEETIVASCGRTIEELMKILTITEDEKQVECEDSSVSIKITTLRGSKGLSAKYVFLVGMNNTRSSPIKLIGFPCDQDGPTDNEICQFIVGITRTRKKCYLISNSGFAQVYNIRPSIFISWIDQPRIESMTVNKDYFKNF